MSDTCNYPAEIERDEDGRYVVVFPDFGWGATDGATRDETLIEARDLLRELLATTMREGKEVVTEREVRHMLNPDHVTKATTIDRTLRRLGKRVSVTIGEAAKRLWPRPPDAADHGPSEREGMLSSESRMREIRTSGLMSEAWKRG